MCLISKIISNISKQFKQQRQNLFQRNFFFALHYFNLIFICLINNLHYLIAVIREWLYNLSKKEMIKKLKSGFFSSQVEKYLQRFKVDKSHDFIQPKHIGILTNLMLVPKTKNELLNFLYKALNSSQNTLKIKALIVLHACIRKSFDQEVCDVVMNAEIGDCSSSDGKHEKESMNSYIRKSVVEFYIIYLKKICMHKESFSFMKQFTKKNITIQSSSNEQQHAQNLLIVSHGFKILNLTNYLLQSQQAFNKMGRYHIQHQEILSMYMQLLQDIDLFNSYLKISVRQIIQKNKQVKESLEACFKGNKNSLEFTDISVQNFQSNFTKKQKFGTSSTKVQTSCIAIPSQQPNAGSTSTQEMEQTKHFFLYINEAQKVSDRLYQFYHNRYYYKILRGMINFPTFLTIENKDYRDIKKKTKKIDRNLVNLVKMSKYDGQKTISTQILKTEPSMLTGKMNMTVSYDTKNSRSLTNVDDTITNAYDNITFDYKQRNKDEEILQYNEEF